LASRVTKKHTGKADFARTVCDAIVDGRPDLYNSPAKRQVSKEEAEKHGWTHFFDGRVCPQGHMAARYVSNEHLCVDCKRLGEGKPAIYSPTHLAQDLTGATPYVNPLATTTFVWNDAKKDQLLAAWINTGGDMIAACKVIGCQPLHVLKLKSTDSQFLADYEAARVQVDEVQLWNMESRAGGNDRVGLSMAQSKFSEFGAKNGLADRAAINPEQMRAGLAQLLSTVERQVDQQDRLERAAEALNRVAQANTASAAPADAGVVEPDVLAQPHDNSDMVS
jgi:hypothetical protein